MLLGCKMYFSLGTYSPPSQASSARLQRGSADELDKLLLLQPSLAQGVFAGAVHLTCTTAARPSPEPSWAHTSLLVRPLCPWPLSLPEGLSGFHQCHPVCSWGCKHLDSLVLKSWRKGHYTSPNRAPGTPAAVCLGPGCRSPITHFSIVIASLGSLKFNCTGHLERLSTLKGSAPWNWWSFMRIHT